MRRNFGRFPFTPDPTSVTASPTACPFLVAQSVSRGHLTVQVMALIMGRHPRVHHHPAGLVSRGRVHPDRARSQAAGRHRHPVLPEPPVRGLRMHAAGTRPLSQLHVLNKT